LGCIKRRKKAEDIINPEKEGMSKANVYKVIKILKAEGAIEDEAS
jgi:Fe2+ or Zn2+ uptake regulation protein